jgi:hypothetical protein
MGRTRSPSWGQWLSCPTTINTTTTNAAGGGPEKLVVLMEGEALLNDASGVHRR